MSNPYMEEAEVIRASIDGLAEGATDEKIVDNKAAFPWWNGNGVTYITNNILRYNNSVYRVVQNHTTQNDWTPDKTPALYNRITATEWEKWEPDNFYKKGSKVTHNGKKWISNVDGNIWEPGAAGVYTWNEV